MLILAGLYAGRRVRLRHHLTSTQRLAYRLTTMKIITTTNWILIGLYGVLLVFTIVNLNRSGNDAAGRGMELGLIFIGLILIAGLVWLNLRSSRAAKITALVVAGLPLLIILYNLISDQWVSYQQQRQDNEQVTNSRNTRRGSDESLS